MHRMAWTGLPGSLEADSWPGSGQLQGSVLRRGVLVLVTAPVQGGMEWTLSLVLPAGFTPRHKLRQIEGNKWATLECSVALDPKREAMLSNKRGKGSPSLGCCASSTHPD